MNIAILSNVNVDMLSKELSNKHHVFLANGYGQWVTYALSESPELEEFSPEIIFVLLDGNALIETCYTEMQGREEIENALSYIVELSKRYSNCIIAVATIDIRPRSIMARDAHSLSSEWVHAWDQGLQSIVDNNANVHCFDLKSLIEDVGRSNVYSEKMWYMGGVPYKVKFISKLACELYKYLQRFKQTRCKVLIVDLDNTLWGGVVGEDSAFGIILGNSLTGAVYRDVQIRIRQIKETGILLCVASKNNEEDVNAVFDNNPYMVLNKDDFVSMHINWLPKYKNIESMAEELNLGLDSFVFLDDNHMERETVRIQLPDVHVADFPNDIANLPKTIEDIYIQYFWSWSQTDEDNVKTQMYKQEALRREEKKTASSIEDYLVSLQIKIKLGELQDSSFDRVVQLINKTNQFNINGIRMDHKQVETYRHTEGNHVYVAHVSDKYGDNGLVCILMLHEDGHNASITNFLMSCRVMGRQIEHAIVRAVEEKLYQNGITTVQSHYIKTPQNAPVRTLWDYLGYTLISEDGDNKQYEISLPVESKTLFSIEWK